MRPFLLPALLACVIGLEAAQPAGPADTRVLVIVTLADQPLVRVAVEEPLVTGVGLTADEADRSRAAREARVLGRVEALGRPSRLRVARAVGELGGEVVYASRAINALAVRVPAQAVAILRARPDVASVEVDVPRASHIDVVPTALGVQGFWNANFRGGATDVAIIDTGVFRDHEAFVARRLDVWPGTTAQGAPRAFHDTAIAYGGASYCDDPADPDDFNGHGTLAAGVVFSQRSDRRGVAYGIDRLYNLKAGYNTCAGGGSSWMTDTMAAVDWSLATDDPPEIFNYSYGATTASDDDSFSRFWDAIVDGYGKIVTISAGNSGSNGTTVGSPGIAHNVLTIANIDDRNTPGRSDDIVHSSSSRGPTVRGRKKPDLAAPGTRVLLPSTWGATWWENATGTSFSAPAVAGVAALLVDAGVGDPRAVKSVLVNTADDYGTTGWDPAFGWGYVNAQRAFDERQQVSLVSVGAPGTASSTLYFERTAAAPTKATIAWNRRVTYATGGMPGPGGDPNNVDLFLYGATHGGLVAWSTSAIDNVEQVVSSTSEPVVLVVRSAAPFGGSSETVALAQNGGFVARVGPAMTLGLAAPAVTATGAVFTVTGTLVNSGDLAGQSHTVTLTPPAGFVLTDGQATKNVGLVPAGGQALVSWSVRAPATATGPSTFVASLAASSYGVVLQVTASTSVAAVAPCAFSVSPQSVSVGHLAASVNLTVHADAGCSWATSSPVGWVRPTPASGTGPATVTLSIDPNPGLLARTTTLFVAGVSVPVQQQGQPATHPREYFLAEGATGDFTLDVAIANPGGTAAPVRVTFLRARPRPPHSIEFELAARARRTIRVNDIPELSNEPISTVVSSLAGLPLAVERTMVWGAGGYGGHTGTAIEQPALRWYFAEGSQGFFDTFLLLANPGDEEATATVRFLREHEGEVTVERKIVPYARETVFAGADELGGLADTSFAIVVESDRPIVAERAMYWSTPDQWWAGGHESAGVAALARDWYFAEGATGFYFDAWLLVGNPNETPANVEFTYLLPDGTSIVDARTVGPRRRLTRLVDEVDPRLADTSFSVTIEADVPIVAERAMYWPGSGWREGHNAFGLVETSLRWGLGEGRVGQAQNFETFVLMANPDPTRTARVRLTFLREAGPAVEREVDVMPGSRATVYVGYHPVYTHVPELVHESFGVLVESLNDVPIAVERAMYWDAGAEHWAGGSSATGTRLP